MKRKSTLLIRFAVRGLMMLGFAFAMFTEVQAQALQVNLPGNYFLCSGDSVPLSPQVSGGAGSYTYTWAPATGLSCTTCPNPIASPQQTTDYTLTVRDLENTEASAMTTVLVSPTATLQVAPAATSVCAGAFVVLTATPSGGSGTCTYRWQIATGPNGPWLDMSSNWNGPELYPATLGWTIGTTHYYRAIYTCSGSLCATATSDPVSVSVAAIPAVSISPATNFVCQNEPLTLQATVSGGTGNCDIQWLSGPTTSGPWTPVPGAIGVTYLPPTDLPGTMYYTASYGCNGTNCGSTTAGQPAKVVTLTPASIIVSANDSIVCVGGTPLLTAQLQNGSPECPLQWQRSKFADGPWINIPQANQLTYQVPAGSPDTSFYRVVYACFSNPPSTTGFRLSIDNAAGVVQGQQVCLDVRVQNFNNIVGMQFSMQYNPAMLQFTSVSNFGLPGLSAGGNFSLPIPGGPGLTAPGTITLTWTDTDWSGETLPNGTTLFTLCFNALASTGSTQVVFSNIPTSIEVFNTALQIVPFTSIPGKVYFGSSCFGATSQPVSITVFAAPTISLTPNQTYCLGNSPAPITAQVSDGADDCSFQWFSAPAPTGPWTLIPDASGDSYLPPTGQVSPSVSYYQVRLVCPGSVCDTVLSNVASVVLSHPIHYTLLPASQTVCTGGSARLIIQADPEFDGCEVRIYQSANGIDGWDNFASMVGGGETTVGSFTSGTFYYRIQYSCWPPDCNGGYSPVVSVTYDDNWVPVINIEATSTEICVGGNTTLTAVPPDNLGSCSLQWQSGNPFLGIWNNIPNATLPVYNYVSQSAGEIFFRVRYTCTSGNCSDFFSQMIMITTNPDPAIGLLPESQTVCINSPVTLTTQVSGGTGDCSFRWFSAPAPTGPWTLIPDAVGDTYQPPTQQLGLTYYLALLTCTGSGCGQPASNPAAVLVTDNLFGDEIRATPLACNVWRLSPVLPPNYFGPINALWTLPDGSTSTDVQIIATQTGVYQLQISVPASPCQSYLARYINSNADECASIVGYVRHDLDENCQPQTSEPGLANWMVRAVGPGGVFHAVTNDEGRYQFSLPLGQYDISLLPPSASWLLCADSYPVSLDQSGQVSQLDIPVKRIRPCPQFEAQLSTSLLRRCFTSTYVVKICNVGTEIAESPVATLVLDNFLSYQSSQLTPSSVQGQTITWTLPALAPGQCRQFNVYVLVSCNAVLGQSHCSTLSVIPDPLCVPTSPAWSGASLQVSGECTGSQARFRVRNAGTGDLDAPVPCIVIEDVVMLMHQPNTINHLSIGEEVVYDFPANGSTYFFSVGQAPHHPFGNPVTLALEGCGTNNAGTFSTGFVNQFPLQNTTTASHTLCLPNIGSWDPNDKQAVPVGYGPEHFIRAGDPLHYQIRFQNTGTDTAFTVIIRDTLSPWLDMATLRPGPSSHDYKTHIDGERTLVFTFDNILLPDSTTNINGSQGFVDFFIRTLDSIPLDTRIENSAAIYFDFNEPVITNTVFHTIGRDFVRLATAVFQPDAPAAEWLLMPNPAREEAWVVLKREVPGLKTAWLYDALGRQVLRLPFEGERCRLPLTDLTPGWYALQLKDAAGRSLGAGRLVVR